jgi:peptidoglycan-associated lipoprotein
MKLKKWVQIIGISLGVVALAACSSGHKNAWSTNEGNQQASAEGAESSGLGDEDRLSDGSDGENTKHLASKNTYYFDFDSDAIHPDDQESIANHAQKLASSGGKVKVMLEGHTDPRGSREYNIGLGERRAKSVAEAMASKGVKPNQLRLVSYGAEKLAAPGATDSDYQKDRRVVLVNTQGQG